MLINTWLNVGALNMKRELPGLPPASTDGCWALMNNNVTTFNSSTLLMTTSTMDTSHYNTSSEAVCSRDFVVKSGCKKTVLWFSFNIENTLKYF